MFKTFGKLIEEGFVSLGAQSHELDPEVRGHLRDLISYYVSQLPDFRGDSLYQRLEEGGVPEGFIQEVF